MLMSQFMGMALFVMLGPGSAMAGNSLLGISLTFGALAS